jgi:predicted unusual protein kinase regulating ubiquinone biosynthesis (AarF/ABC1/UbiB family)
LVKALVTVEGVARALYPDIDITQAAGPYAMRMVAQWALEPSVMAERMPRALQAALKELAG